MKYLISALCGLFAFVALFTSAEAGTNCRKGYTYSVSRTLCIKNVNAAVDAQDAAAAGGPKWSGVTSSSCNKASKEMDRMMAQCRKYDKNQGGKSVEQCGKCCRQLREYSRRWQQCHNKGFAPPVAYSTIRGSIERLGCKWSI